MGETLKEFGVQWPLLIASVINFFILLLLMRKFLYTPVLKVLDERKAIVAKSLDDAKKIEEDREKTEQRLKASLRLANEEALKTIEQARKAAEKVKDEIVQEAEAQAEQMVERAKAEIVQEREEAAKLLRKEAAQLITQAMEKVMAENKSPELNDKLIKETLEKVNG